MQGSQPTLLLTRPKEQSATFLSDCEKRLGRRMPVVVSPIIRIEHMDDPPDLAPYATIILTSANGVAACGPALRGRDVVTVGAKTCDLAIQAGANARTLGDDVDALINRADEIQGPALHCRGAHARGDLAQSLRAKGVETDEAVLYDQIAQPLTPAAHALLQGTGDVVAPLFSPRSALLLSDAAITADMRIIAMSKAVADAWSGPGAIDTVDAPTAHSMALQTIRYF